MYYLLTMGIGLAGGFVLGLTLPRADVAGFWTAIMAFATVCLAVATYKQTQTSRRALDASYEQAQISSKALEDSLRPFLVWSGYWQLTDGQVPVAKDLDERTFLAKNTGRTPARILGVESPPNCEKLVGPGDKRLLSPESEMPVLEVGPALEFPYAGEVVVHYEDSQGKRYEQSGRLEWIIMAAENQPRGRYGPTPEEKAGP